MRAERPFDPKALKEADDAFYLAHPERVKGGKRQPLAADDPLRDEWLCLYQAKGGKVSHGPPGTSPAGSAKAVCQKIRASLKVTLQYTPYPAPVRGATVTISGPETRNGVTDAKGVVQFSDLSPGPYEVKATLSSGTAIVDKARGHINSTDWDYSIAKAPYPANTNKCNLFVYEMAGAAGIPVPMLSRFSVSQFKSVSYPPLAGQWADPGQAIPGWTLVTDPQPGDIIGEKIQYADASGHVGIVSYPEDAQALVNLAPADNKSLAIDMKRLTLSQSANTETVVENDWGWRAGQKPLFRRYTP